MFRKNPQQYQKFVHSPANTGLLTHGEPVGTETISAVALDLPPIPRQPGFNSESDFESLRNDRKKIVGFVQIFNSVVTGTLVDIV